MARAERALVRQRVDVLGDVQQRVLARLNGGTSMSFSPTTSGTAPARIAVASWLVSWFGEVRCSTTFRFLCVALNSFDQRLRRAVGGLPGPEVHRAGRVHAEVFGGVDGDAGRAAAQAASTSAAAATAMMREQLGPGTWPSPSPFRRSGGAVVRYLGFWHLSEPPARGLREPVQPAGGVARGPARWARAAAARPAWPGRRGCPTGSRGWPPPRRRLAGRGRGRRPDRRLAGRPPGRRAAPPRGLDHDRRAEPSQLGRPAR